MANPYVNLSHVTQVTLHEGWLEHKSFHEYKWKKSWLMLQGNTLYFFNSQNTGQSTPTGILNIDNHFKFVKKDRGSEKAGYKFELHTSRSVTKFKACKFSERELWRAYLEGIATGQVSERIDLPPEILVQIRLLLQAQYINNNGSNLADSGLGDSIDSVPIIPPRDEDEVDHSNDSVSADSGCVDDFYLEPANSHLLNYVFYNESNRKELPSWFFQNCTREMAEEILLKGNQFGNTLMRKGTSNTSNLVISKKIEVRKEDYSHYVIEIQPDGYKLRVENPHQPMKCLTDIMNFFVQTSGALMTKPMTCNNLQKIGISPDHIYNPVIIPNPPPCPETLDPTPNPETLDPTPSQETLDPTPNPETLEADKNIYRNIPPQNHKHPPPCPETLDPTPNPETLDPTPNPETQEAENNVYLNIRPPNNKHKAWMKHRSQSIPNMTPLMDLRPDMRRLSVSVEADKSPSSTTPNTKLLPSSRRQTQQDIPLPAPPPPPTSSPPKMRNTSNRSRVTSIASPPIPSSVPPPSPHNDASARKSHLGSTLSLASKFDEIVQKKTTPQVALKPVKKDVDESQNKKKIGDVSEEEFKKKLEMMFVDNKSKTMPAISGRRQLLEKPNLKSVVTHTCSIDPHEDVVYDDPDLYQNLTQQ